MHDNSSTAAIIMEVMETKELPINCAARNSVWAYPKPMPPRFDHRFIKKKVRAAQCFKRFHAAERTLEGIEAVNMMRKGQVKRSAGGATQGQAKFVRSLFGLATYRRYSQDPPRINSFLVTLPA